MAALRPELVDSVKELEPLSPTVTRLAALLGDPDWRMEEIEECVALDQALTPKLLSIANSALWFRGRAVGTVREAVMRMGSGAVVGLALGACVRRRFRRALPEYGLKEGDLWKHSVAAALAASVLDASTNATVPPEAFTAALLHDLGKLVAARAVEAEATKRIVELSRGGGISRSDAEIEVLGLDHAALGGVAAVHWKLPERVVTGIAFHHAPLEPSDPIASVVHVADVVGHRASALVDKSSSGATLAPALPAALERLSLQETGLERVSREVANRLPDLLRRYA